MPVVDRLEAVDVEIGELEDLQGALGHARFPQRGACHRAGLEMTVSVGVGNALEQVEGFVQLGQGSSALISLPARSHGAGGSAAAAAM